METQWTQVVGSFQCNCRLLVCPHTGEAVLVDPGDEAEKILGLLSRVEKETGQTLKVKYLLHTHAHLDHVGATRKVKESLKESGKGEPPSILLHRRDHELYQNLVQQGQLFGIQYEAPLPVDQFLEDEENLRVGDLNFSVIHTPGHSPGSVCFRLHEDSGLGTRETLFSGDTLFRGSVGRTDLWGGNGDQLFKNIRQRIFTLDDDTTVCPGHGPDTQVGIEKRSNPFFQ